MRRISRSCTSTTCSTRALLLLALISATCSPLASAGRRQLSLLPNADPLPRQEGVVPSDTGSNTARDLLVRANPGNGAPHHASGQFVLYDDPVLEYDLVSFPFKICMGPNKYVGKPVRRCVKQAQTKVEQLAVEGYGRSKLDPGDLKSCLERAELVIDGRKTAIVVPFNAGFVDLAEHILCSLKSHGTDRVLFWALDERAYRVGKGQGMNVYFDPTGYNTRKKVWGRDPEFYEMMNERPHFWGRVLEAGYDMLFVDADVVFLWDPRDAIRHALHQRFANMDIDLIMSVDEFNVMVKPTCADRDVEGCAGYFYMRANERTVLLMKRMSLFLTTFTHLLKQGIKFPLWSWNDQTALNWFIRESHNCRYDAMTRDDLNRGDNLGAGRYASCASRPGVRVGYFDQYHYVNGHIFWSEQEMQKVFELTGPQWSPVVVHANGRANKLMAFQDKGLLQFKNLTDHTCKEGFTSATLGFSYRFLTEQMQ